MQARQRANYHPRSVPAAPALYCSTAALRAENPELAVTSSQHRCAWQPSRRCPNGATSPSCGVMEWQGAGGWWLGRQLCWWPVANQEALRLLPGRAQAHIVHVQPLDLLRGAPQGAGDAVHDLLRHQHALRFFIWEERRESTANSGRLLAVQGFPACSRRPARDRHLQFPCTPLQCSPPAPPPPSTWGPPNPRKAVWEGWLVRHTWPRARYAGQRYTQSACISARSMMLWLQGGAAAGAANEVSTCLGRRCGAAAVLARRPPPGSRSQLLEWRTLQSKRQLAKPANNGAAPQVQRVAGVAVQLQIQRRQAPLPAEPHLRGAERPFGASQRFNNEALHRLASLACCAPAAAPPPGAAAPLGCRRPLGLTGAAPHLVPRQEGVALPRDCHVFVAVLQRRKKKRGWKVCKCAWEGRGKRKIQPGGSGGGRVAARQHH